MLVFWKTAAGDARGAEDRHFGLCGGARAACVAGRVSDLPELKHAPVFRYNRFFRPMLERVGGGRMESGRGDPRAGQLAGKLVPVPAAPFLAGKPTSTLGHSFDAFVEAYTSGKPPAFANVGSQAKFVEPSANGTAVTHLFRYEDQARPDRLPGGAACGQRSTSRAGMYREGGGPEISPETEVEAASQMRR